MAKRLKVWVHVDGQGYGPGSEVPPEVAKLITNPHVWADEGDTEPVDPPVRAAKHTRSTKPRG